MEKQIQEIVIGRKYYDGKTLVEVTRIKNSVNFMPGISNVIFADVLDTESWENKHQILLISLDKFKRYFKEVI